MAVKPEIKLSTSIGSSQKKDSSGKTATSALLTMPKPLDHHKLWKILKEMGIPDHLTCLLRNLYAGQEETVRTGHGTTDWFQIGKGVRQGCILSPCLFNLYAEYIMWNAGLDEAQLESRLPGEISVTSDMQMILPLWQKAGLMLKLKLQYFGNLMQRTNSLEGTLILGKIESRWRGW